MLNMRTYINASIKHPFTALHKIRMIYRATSGTEGPSL